MRGRKPKPTFLKIVAGNPGNRPLNPDEPIVADALADIPAPAWLTATQALVWRTALARAPEGLLRSLDESIFVTWVVACDLHRQASEKIAEYGAVVKAPGGMPMQSPYVGILNKQAAVMAKAVAEMGFSPSSRSRVRVEGGGKKQNRFAELKELPDKP